MELLQLTYFCDAAESENFSKTAQKYGVPPSNISQTVRRLETELGTRLFLRQSNRILLNEKGRMFYKKIKAALSLISDAKEEMSDCDGEVHGEIKVLILTNRRIVTEVIEQFKRRYPAVTFLINHTPTGENAEYSFIVSDSMPDNAFYEKKLVLEEQIMIACHKDSNFSKLAAPSVADLKNERIISMSAGTSLYGVLLRMCADAGFTPNVAIQSDDPFYVRKYLDMGLGVTPVPAVAWCGLLSPNTVVKSIGSYYRQTYIFYPKKQFMSKAKVLFLKELTERFEKENS